MSIYTHKQRRYQYGMCLLMPFVLSACNEAIIRTAAAKRQSEAVKAILRAHGQVDYDFQLDASGHFIERAESPPSPWVRILHGKDPCTYVVGASVRDEASQKYLKYLPKLQSVGIWDTNLSADGIRNLKGLRSLRSLILSGDVADAELKYLRDMRSLRVFMLRSGGVTDAGLKYLEGLSDLRWLILDNTEVTEEGVKRLQRALPKCYIERSEKGKTKGELKQGRTYFYPATGRFPSQQLLLHPVTIVIMSIPLTSLPSIHSPHLNCIPIKNLRRLYPTRQST